MLFILTMHHTHDVHLHYVVKPALWNASMFEVEAILILAKIYIFKNLATSSHKLSPEL